VCGAFVSHDENPPGGIDGITSRASGEQTAGTGTGWMIAPLLMITNNHVIRSRPRNVRIAASDLDRQIAAATIQFDYDGPNSAGETVAVQQLTVRDEDLDYAVLGLKKAPGRQPLPLRASVVKHDPKAPAQVNLIQHPNGKPKQIGIRNNSIYQSDTNLLLYFTDTLEGSSGAPVFDDFWKAVALHRGFRPIENFVFQGNPTSVVNYGTHIRRILESIKAKSAEAWQVICSAQPQLGASI
jgi:endonuclease G